MPAECISAALLARFAALSLPSDSKVFKGEGGRGAYTTNCGGAAGMWSIKARNVGCGYNGLDRNGTLGEVAKRTNFAYLNSATWKNFRNQGLVQSLHFQSHHSSLIIDTWKIDLMNYVCCGFSANFHMKP